MVKSTARRFGIIWAGACSVGWALSDFFSALLASWLLFLVISETNPFPWYFSLGIVETLGMVGLLAIPMAIYLIPAILAWVLFIGGRKP